ncbi:hypothetical protein PT2222_80040 [Paraburkholderia tropica]
MGERGGMALSTGRRAFAGGRLRAACACIDRSADRYRHRATAGNSRRGRARRVSRTHRRDRRAFLFCRAQSGVSGGVGAGGLGKLCASGGADLAEQIRMTIEQPEQLHQRQRRFRLTVLVTGKRIDATAENFGGFALIEIELAAHGRDEQRIDVSGVDLALKRGDALGVAVTVHTLEYRLAARRAIVARHGRNHGRLAFVRVSQIAVLVDQIRTAAGRTFHDHHSLNETIRTSSMTVNLR